MNKISEISRRIMFHEDEGMACGPEGSTAIMAEIVVDVDGQLVYLFGEWVDLVDEYSFEANTKSLFDAYEKIFETEDNEDEWLKAIEERDSISENRIEDYSIFEDFYEELKQMIQDEMAAHGIEDYDDDEDWEDEEEDG